MLRSHLRRPAHLHPGKTTKKRWPPFLDDTCTETGTGAGVWCPAHLRQLTFSAPGYPKPQMSADENPEPDPVQICSYGD